MITFRLHLTILAGLCAAVLGTTSLTAQVREKPYWAALKFNETNMRVGPSREYPIDWVYKRKGLPVRVLRSRDEWDLVEDPDGTKGWISGSQLTRSRGAIVIGKEPVALREEPASSSKLRWRAEPGVVADLLSCREGWCEIDADGRTGWVKASRLWGVEKAAGEG
ncbi:MAG: SH3 domain-containing protein [Pseudomonadota bacterium]